jgi:hypothetical protein
MEEEDALSDAPERSSSELVGAGAALRDAVGQAFAHVVYEQVGEKIRSLIGKRSTRTGRGAARNHCPCGKRRRMAVRTPNLRKQVASLLAGRCGGAGVGGASIRMKLANASMSEMTAGFEMPLGLPVVEGVVVKFSVSLGVGLKIQPEFRRALAGIAGSRFPSRRCRPRPRT